jgi:TonB family protein
MNRLLTAAFLMLIPLSVYAQSSLAQQEPTDSARKIASRVTPQYPEMARSIRLKGIVKAEALVEPSGVVKSVEVKGGNPVLGRAAENAIYKWRWVPSTRQTREAVEVKFDPQ